MVGDVPFPNTFTDQGQNRQMGRMRQIHAIRISMRLDIMMPSGEHHDVRTTLTIDDDVARQIDQEVRRTGDSFKGTVNRLLRQGLQARRKPEPKKRFQVTPFALNTGLGTRYEKVEDLIEAMEGPMHR
jgi:hypothetical protein